MRIYIANLGKYNEGELVGAWFTPPIDFDEVKERIGLNDEYEEYAIHDYELPFEIDEYTPIEEVNRLCEMVEDLPEDIQAELHELQSYFGGIEELCEHEDDIIPVSYTHLLQRRGGNHQSRSRYRCNRHVSRGGGGLVLQGG